jgi:hypothetical protein
MMGLKGRNHMDMETTAVLLIAGVLAVNILLAAVFGNLASKKGHSGAAYGTLVFFFGFIGMIVVIALPDRVRAAREASQQQALAAMLQSQAGGGGWTAGHSILVRTCRAS